jgi:hypothetical protein
MFKNPITIFAIAIVMSGCSQSNQVTNETLEAEQAVGVFDVNKYALNKLVCDPFDPDSPPGGFSAGLKAELFYLRDNQPRYNKVQDYISQGQKSDQTLFFRDINVPTRKFDKGFPLQTGGEIKNDEGKKLVEYFALRFKSVLKLAPNQPKGLYELALLSDDGAVLKLQDRGEWVTVVNNDGGHPTRLGCGQTIEMSHDRTYLLELDYFQGPRHHISVIPIWRRVTPDTNPETRCGQTGNNLFFDYNNNSKPQAAYLDLLTRGWQPIAAENYELPIQVEFNPCAGFDSPKISNVNVVFDATEGIVVTWTTDIPATSQLLYKHSRGITETLTNADNVLRTSHRVSIGTPSVDSTYTIQAVSVSANLGKTMSGPAQVYVPIFDID